MIIPWLQKIADGAPGYGNEWMREVYRQVYTWLTICAIVLIAVTGLLIKGFTGNALKFFRGSVPVVAKPADTKRVANDVSIRNLAPYYKVPPPLVYLSPRLHSQSRLGVKFTNWIFLPARPHPWRSEVISGCIRIVRRSEMPKVDLYGDAVRGSFPMIFDPEVVQVGILLDHADIQPSALAVHQGFSIVAGRIGGLLRSFGLAGNFLEREVRNNDVVDSKADVYARQKYCYPLRFLVPRPWVIAALLCCGSVGLWCSANKGRYWLLGGLTAYGLCMGGVLCMVSVGIACP